MTPPNPNWPPDTKKSSEEEKLLFSPEEMAIAERFAKLRDEEAVSFDDPYFEGRISASDIAKHKKRVAQLEKEFDEKATPQERQFSIVASAVEYVFAKRAKEWIGMDAQLTNKKDDMDSAVDMYLAPEDGGGPLGLSIDITFSGNEKGLRGKIQKTRNYLLDRGKMCELVFYKPLNSSPESETALEMPKVVVALRRERAMQVIKRYAEGVKVPEDSVAGLLSLYQIGMQLQHYIWYCQRIEKNNPIVSRTIPVYERALKEQKRLWEKKLNELKPRSVEYEAFNLMVKKMGLDDPLTQLLQKALDEELPLEERKAA